MSAVALPLAGAQGETATTGIAERYDRGGLLAAIVVMAAWHGYVLATIIFSWSRLSLWAPSVLVWLVYAAVGTASAVVLLRGGGRSAVLPLVACPLLLAGVVIIGLTQTSSFFASLNWPFTATAFFALVVLWRHGVAALLAFLAADGMTGLAVLIALGQTDRVSIARFIGLCGGAGLPLTLFAGSKIVSAMARRAAQAEEEVARTRIAERAAEAVQEARRIRYEMIRGVVAELLDGLAAGLFDLAEVSTRQRIAVAVTRLRRLLVENDDVPDPLSHELRACADAAERRGVAVDLAAPSGTIPLLPVQVRRALTEPVIEVLAAAASRARVTVVAAPSHVAVAVLADARLEVLAPSLHVDVETSQDSEGELLWVQAQWTGASESP